MCFSFYYWNKNQPRGVRVHGQSTSTVNPLPKQAAVIVLHNTHLHSPPPKQRGSQLFSATPFHTGAVSPLWRGEELPDNGSRAAEPKWLLEISFPQMKHASSSAVKKNHARALWMGPSARLGNKTLPLRSVMHACTPGSRGEEVITWNISEIPCGQSAVVSVEATSSSYAAMLANLSR